MITANRATYICVGIVWGMNEEFLHSPRDRAVSTAADWQRVYLRKEFARVGGSKTGHTKIIVVQRIINRIDSIKKKKNHVILYSSTQWAAVRMWDCPIRDPPQRYPPKFKTAWEKPNKKIYCKEPSLKLRFQIWHGLKLNCVTRYGNSPAAAGTPPTIETVGWSASRKQNQHFIITHFQ